MSERRPEALTPRREPSHHDRRCGDSTALEKVPSLRASCHDRRLRQIAGGRENEKQTQTPPSRLPDKKKTRTSTGREDKKKKSRGCSRRPKKTRSTIHPQKTFKPKNPNLDDAVGAPVLGRQRERREAALQELFLVHAWFRQELADLRRRPLVYRQVEGGPRFQDPLWSHLRDDVWGRRPPVPVSTKLRTCKREGGGRGGSLWGDERVLLSALFVARLLITKTDRSRGSSLPLVDSGRRASIGVTRVAV